MLSYFENIKKSVRNIYFHKCHKAFAFLIWWCGIAEDNCYLALVFVKTVILTYPNSQSRTRN